MVKPLATAAACIGAAVAALYWGQGYIIGFIYGQAMKGHRAAEGRGLVRWLRAEGRSYREVAEACGISVATAHRYGKKA